MRADLKRLLDRFSRAIDIGADVRRFVMRHAEAQVKEVVTLTSALSCVRFARRLQRIVRLLRRSMRIWLENIFIGLISHPTPHSRAHRNEQQ